MNKIEGMPPHPVTDKQIEILLHGAERDIERHQPLESQLVSATVLARMCLELKALRLHVGKPAGNSTQEK